MGRDEWLQVPAGLRHVLKIDDLKFYQCPVSCITPRTWRMLRTVNETTNADGDILHLPYPGTILEQPEWYREAVQIVRSERARHRREEMEKLRNK